MITGEILQKAKELAEEQAKKNGAPVWGLTEIAVEKGKELAKKYKLEENSVMAALYLAHIVYNDKEDSEIQIDHPKLSAELAKKYLNEWGVFDKEMKSIVDAIASHHNNKSNSVFSEIVRNAECFKFVTIEGVRIFYDDVKKNRDYSDDQAKSYAVRKMGEKLSLLSLSECLEEARKNIQKISAEFE